MNRFENFHRLRYIVCFVAWVAILALYSQRVNLSIAIIGMVKEKGSSGNDTSGCPVRYNKTVTDVQKLTEKYEWNESMQNYVLLAYNVGYMLGHVPGAFLSIKYGSRAVMIFCITASTVLTFVSIFTAPYQWVFFTIRSLIGFVNGPLYPMIHETIAGHAPPAERTYLTMITHTGNLCSLAIILPLGGYFVENYVNGWRLIFYFSGALGVFASVAWIIFVYSHPDENPLMSKKESVMIIESIYPKGKPPKKTFENVPFRKIFASPHLYIFTCAHFGKMFILYMNLFGIVKYLYKYFNLSSIQAGNIAVIPFAADFVFQMFYPKLVNFMKECGLRMTTVRKLNTFIGAIGCSSFLIAASFIPCTNLIGGIILQSLSLMFLAPYQAGYFTAIIEHAPQFAGVTFSFINIGGTFSGVVQRYITALMAENFPDIREAYKYSFIVTGCGSFFFSMVYVLFGTAEIQPWAQTSRPEEVKNTEIKESDKVETESP